MGNLKPNQLFLNETRSTIQHIALGVDKQVHTFSKGFRKWIQYGV